MAEPTPPPLINAMPPAPVRTQAGPAYAATADTFAAAIVTLVTQINLVVAWMVTSTAIVAAYVATGGQAATAALQSAQMAADAVADSEAARDAAKAYRDSAAAIAGAMGSAAGLPSMLGKKGRPLIVNAAETGVEWGTPAFMDATQTGAFRAQAGKSYWLDTTVTEVSLPLKVSSVKGDSIDFSKSLAVTPIIKTTDGALIKGPKKSDTSVQYNLDATIKFVYNGTDWEV